MRFFARMRGRKALQGFVLFVIVGCGAADSGIALGTDSIQGPAASIPSDVNLGSNPTYGGAEERRNPGTGVVIGDSCRSQDPEKLCLALRYVVYRDSSGGEVVSQEAASNNIRQINSVFAKCNLGFQIEEFNAVNPGDFGLQYRTSDYGELDQIRNAFVNNQTLLVATTGTWNRLGSLGNTGANAWTAMPGGGPYGAILEKPVGTYANIIAHELGHYLNLLHVSDASDLMNPIIYTTSTNLYSSQCGTARQAAKFFWSRMLR